MISETFAIAGMLTHIRSLGGALINERDTQKAAAIQIDLTNKIIQAQAQLTQIQSTIIEKNGLIQTLTQRVSELEANKSEKARYRLAKFSVAGEFCAYQLRPVAELAERIDEPDHLACQPCFEAGKKIILQVGNGHAVCPVCKTSGRVGQAEPSVVSRRSGRGGVDLTGY